MRKAIAALAAAGLLVATASVAMAQGGPGGGPGGPGGGGPGGGGFGRGGMMGGQMGGMGGGLMLLRIKEVQTELKMSDAQVEKIAVKQQENMQAMQELRQTVDFQNMTPEERQKFSAKMQGMQDKAVADILDATQLKRFKELEIQRMGAMALSRKDIAEALKITDDQKTKMREIQQASGQAMRELMPQGGMRDMSEEERAALMKKFTDARAATDAKIIGVLTPEQATKFKAMQGVAFKFPAMQFGRGGFGGPGGGRRGGGQGGPGGGGPGGGNPPA